MSKHALICWWQFVGVGTKWTIGALLNADTQHAHFGQGNFTVLMAKF
jgi:hypothetical protein